MASNEPRIFNTDLWSYTSGIVDDVVFAHKRPGKGDASRAYTQSDSPGSEPGAKSDVYDCLVMVALCNRADHYIFILFLFLLLSSSFFFSSPNLSGRRLDVYHTSTHGVALVRI